jgi:DNA adenine methylase
VSLYCAILLRYPGGKQRLGKFFSRVLALNRLVGGAYVEVFAGGAGVALYLLRNQLVDSIHLNDIDRSVYAFWYAVTKHNAKLCKMIAKTPVTIYEWDRQKQIQRAKSTAPLLELGFSTLFLNRTNRSGILRAGIIGGRCQSGQWKLDARFNKETIKERISSVRPLTQRIHITCMDALAFLSSEKWQQKTLIYLAKPPASNRQERTPPPSA